MSSAISKGAFPPSHFFNKLDDKLAHKVALQTNVTHFCLVCQSEVCCKSNWFATLKQLCEQVCRQVCCKNVMVETHLKSATCDVTLLIPNSINFCHAVLPSNGDGKQLVENMKEQNKAAVNFLKGKEILQRAATSSGQFSSRARRPLPFLDWPSGRTRQSEYAKWVRSTKGEM
jgi:hypothetical protein